MYWRYKQDTMCVCGSEVYVHSHSGYTGGVQYACVGARYACTRTARRQVFLTCVCTVCVCVCVCVCMAVHTCTQVMTVYVRV